MVSSIGALMWVSKIGCIHGDKIMIILPGMGITNKFGVDYAQ